MASFPGRCQHLKVNGTQCGSPALRRNRFCFFHKRFQDERIKLATQRKRASATFILPVLEDANSIQIALMQVMRLLVSQQIEPKTASLLLYALQTASSNLRMTDFKPYLHDVILDPREARNSCLGETIWEDDDFEEEDDDESGEEPKAKLDPAEALYEQMRQERIAKAGKRAEEEEKLKIWAEKHPEVRLVRDEYGHLKSVPKERPQAQPAPKKPAAKHPSEEEFAADIDAIARKHFFPNMPPEVAKQLEKKMNEG